jgi:hypothetical protein
MREKDHHAKGCSVGGDESSVESKDDIDGVDVSMRISALN